MNEYSLTNPLYYLETEGFCINNEEKIIINRRNLKKYKLPRMTRLKSNYKKRYNKIKLNPVRRSKSLDENSLPSHKYQRIDTNEIC